MASGSNAPIISDALVAWPPPPTRSQFTVAAGSPPDPGRKQRFSLATPPTTFTATMPGAPPLMSFAEEDGRHGEPSYQPLVGTSPRLGDNRFPARIRTESDDEHQHQSRPDYPVPKRPLTPAQLGRIAQSFGIIAPILADSGSVSLRSPSRSSSTPMLSTSSQSLIAVVPPEILMPPEPGIEPAERRKRVRRFRRGRLLPLQPTLSAMLVSIAREFGLPSTLGISVYLGANGGAMREELLGSGSSVSSDDSDAGPLITSQTWSALFASSRATSSTSASPSSTPRKHKDFRPTFGAGKFSSASPMSSTGDSIARGPVPTRQQRAKTRSDDDASPFRSSHGSSSASSFSPQTPGSFTMSTLLPRPVFGTIEFEVDPDEARWLDSWLRSGGGRGRRRATSDAESSLDGSASSTPVSAVGNGIRELTLVGRLKDERPKFLRDMEEKERASERAREAEYEAEREAQLASQREAQREAMRQRKAEEHAQEEAARAMAEEEEAKDERHSNQFDDYAPLDDGESGSDYSEAETGENAMSPRSAGHTDDMAADPMDDLAELRAERQQRQGPLTELDIGTNRVLSGEIEEDKQEVLNSTSDLHEVAAMLSPTAVASPTGPSDGGRLGASLSRGDSLLASPIALPKDDGPIQMPKDELSRYPIPKSERSPSVRRKNSTPPVWPRISKASASSSSSSGRSLKEDSRSIPSLEEDKGTIGSPIGSVASPTHMLGALQAVPEDQRASGIVMADQLNSLEKSGLRIRDFADPLVMKDLSPREIRFNQATSPSALSPGHASGARSPRTPTSINDLPPRGKSRLPYLQPDGAPNRNSTVLRSVSEPTSAAPQVTPGGNRTVSAAGGTPQPGSSPLIMSPRDGQSGFPAKDPPPRPQRPPTPDLTTPEFAAHRLPQDKAATVKEARRQAGLSMVSNTSAGGRGVAGAPRPNSISLKGLRRQVSKSVMGRPPSTYRQSGYGDASGEPPTTGLFPRQTMVIDHAGPPPSSFASMRDSTFTYASPEAPARSPNGPSAGDEEKGLASRFFGLRRKRESVADDGRRMTITHISSPIATTHTHISPSDLVQYAAAAPPPPLPEKHLASPQPLRPTPASPIPIPSAGASNPATPVANPLALPPVSASPANDDPNSPSSSRVRRKPVPNRPSVDGSASVSGSGSGSAHHHDSDMTDSPPRPAVPPRPTA